jgi:hypothetical protein
MTTKEKPEKCLSSPPYDNQEGTVIQNTMTLYHGSNTIVDKPTLGHSRKTLDFGADFYTTLNKLQAVDFVHKIMLRRKSET